MIVGTVVERMEFELRVRMMKRLLSLSLPLTDSQSLLVIVVKFFKLQLLQFRPCSWRIQADL